MKQHHYLKKLLFAGVLFAGCFSLQAQTDGKIIYVKPGGTGGGQSWTDALGDIQQAINTSDASSIFVAGGDYRISAPLVISSSKKLYGGFAGNESEISERELSDLDGNGIVEPWEFTYATYLSGSGSGRVIEANVSRAEIDGFTIRKGKAEAGGGVSLAGGASIVNSIIENNVAGNNGGGISLNSSIMRQCLVRNNVYSGNGGGVYAIAGSNVEGCKIVNNSVQTGDLKIGDIIEGGIVYKVDYTTREASIVSLERSAKIVWSDAAGWCGAYAGGGYSLPGSTELQQVYIVKDILNNALVSSEGVPFDNEPYWSSSESGVKAFQVIFDTGYAGTLDKTVNLSVRAIKSITF